MKNHTLWNLSFFTLKFLPVDTWHKLNIHKTFRRLPGRLLNVLCEFNLRPVFTGWKMCKRAVEKDLWSMESVLGKYKTRHKKCAKELLKSDHMHWSLFLISIKPKRWVKALLKGVRMHRNMLFFFTQNKTQETCERAIFDSQYTFAYVPDQYNTLVICNKATEKEPVALPYVPDDYNTMEMCEVVVLEFPHVLKFVSDQHKMQEMYEELLRGSCTYWKLFLIYLSQLKCWNTMLMMKSLIMMIRLLFYLMAINNARRGKKI